MWVVLCCWYLPGCCHTAGRLGCMGERKKNSQGDLGGVRAGCQVRQSVPWVILQQYSFVQRSWLVLVCSELLLGTVGRLNLWLLGVASVARKSF